MKKRVALILSLVMLVSMTACDSIPKIPHIGREEETTAAAPTETEPTDTAETQPLIETETEPAETTAEPTKKPTATPTPKPTAAPTETDPAEPTEDPNEDPVPTPVVIISQEEQEVVEYDGCVITHTLNGRSWRFEGLPDILTFHNDLLTIEIPGYDVAASVINDTLSYMNQEAEDKFEALKSEIEVPEYPEEKLDPETGKPMKGELEDPTWSAVVYTQTASVVLCNEKAIGIRYEYSATDADGVTTSSSEYLLFDLRTGDYLSSEDLARSAGLFGDHLYYMALELLPEVYPDADIDEDTFAKELIKVKDAYDWEIVDRDGTIVLRFWYPAGSFSVLRLEDVVFEAEFEQFSMYFTPYFRSLFE